MEHRSLLRGALGASMLCQACMSLPAPMRLSNPDKAADTTFTGIDALLKEHKEVRILVIHGMGSQQVGFSSDFQRALKSELLVVAEKACEVVDTWKSPFGTEAYTARCPYSRGSDRLIVYEFTWSGLTQVFENLYVKYDWERHNGERAIVNGMVKKDLLDERFTDAVVYAGAYAETIQKATRRAICVLMTDGLGQPQDCLFDKARSTPRATPPPIVLVSHSLGSMIAFETLQGLIDDKTEKEGSVSARQFVENLALVGMFANQLPLLWLSRIPANASPLPGGEPPSPLTVLSKTIGPLPIVAVSDPNDLLTFPLDRGWPERLHKQDTRVVNARITNAGNVYGIVANPGTAHTKYWSNDCGVRLLARGSLSCPPPFISGLHYDMSGRNEWHSRIQFDFGKLLRPNDRISFPVYASMGTASAGLNLALSARNAQHAIQLRTGITRTIDWLDKDVPVETLFGVGGRLSIFTITTGVDFLRGSDSKTRVRWSIGTGW